VLPVWLITDDEHRIRRIIAPDILYNPNFGAGFHGRIYDYPSEDKQWSVIAGLKQKVEREFNAEYTLGRLREHTWSFTGSVVYDRDGAPRFFGIGNGTPQENETNYTSQQEVLQAQLGYNFNRKWQLLYTALAFGGRAAGHPGQGCFDSDPLPGSPRSRDQLRATQPAVDHL